MQSTTAARNGAELDDASEFQNALLESGAAAKYGAELDEALMIIILK